MHIDVYIPYEPCSRLGRAYNRAMEQSKDWVLFLDHDLFLCNPNWYDICLDAIKKIGKRAGWITCMTNNIPANYQRADIIMSGVPENNDLVQHINYAKRLDKQFNGIYEEAKESGGKLPDFCGYFILTHKEAWQKAGGFKDDFYVDCWYGWALYKAGYKLIRIPGLYVYHLGNEKKKLWGGWAKWKGITGDDRGV
jgi:GT2 family glycosyltransferase